MTRRRSLQQHTDAGCRLMVAAWLDAGASATETKAQLVRYLRCHGYKPSSANRRATVWLRRYWEERDAREAAALDEVHA